MLIVVRKKIFFISIVNNLKKISEKEKIVTSRTEPIAPDIVFFGLIFVNFGPLKILPNTKPPISESKQIIRK